MTIEGKWGYSTNEEWFEVAGDTREEALAEGHANARYPFWVGKFRKPICEEVVDADLVLEHIGCQDDYCGDWGDDVFNCSTAQSNELTAALQKVIGEWLDRHGLRPEFGLISSPERINGPKIEL